MARSLLKAKLAPVVFVADSLSHSVTRRGYAEAASGSEPACFSRGGSRTVTTEKPEPKAAMKEESGASNAWAPDPITGYYRPQNCAVEIDPAELREMLLNHKVRPN